VPLTPAHRHAWDLSPAAARDLQLRLADRVEQADRFGGIDLVAGIDTGFEAAGSITRAAVAVLRLPGLALIESALARRPTGFPYVPGLLSFREIPAALEALAALAAVPDLLLCDGQGFAHPRRFGFACHLGWLLDVPCIGVAKSRLIGAFAAPGPARGAWTPLLDRDQTIGAALRSRAGVKPVFVSIGHQVGLANAIRLTLACAERYRLPEPTRLAHQLASARQGAGGVERGGAIRRSRARPSGGS
jgi:deoxyribonuclease V